jgi:CDP-glucose 4,6-dehydratase
MDMIRDFWRNKSVLVTGHTGFKGSWLALWLQEMGAKVSGFSLPPPSSPNLFTEANIASGMESHFGDIRDVQALTQVFEASKPEVVFHLAAQSLVLDSYEDPLATYSTNVTGSLNILECVRSTPGVKSVVMVSTDKCYENKEWLWGYREIDPLGGYDPYSSSKACMELMLSSYRASFFPHKDYKTHQVAIASARAGNVIGGGDWAKNRLVPDIVSAIINKQKVRLRYPNSIRPWQHVLEPLSGYLMLAEKLYLDGPLYAESWNFGPHDSSAKSVNWIAKYLLQKANSGCCIEVSKTPVAHEAHFLKLDCSKAHSKLHWSPKWELSQALDNVLSWSLDTNTDKQTLCLQQIAEYSSLLESQS